MGKAHKIHRGSNAWKKDLLLLTCIFRLRIQPSISYPTIVNLLLHTLPKDMDRLVEKTSSKEIREKAGEKDSDMEEKEWLAGHLQELFERAEHLRSEPWKLARGVEGRVVVEILVVAGMLERGFGVMTEKEMELQIQWRKEGDWRAGSVPLGKGELRLLETDTKVPLKVIGGAYNQMPDRSGPPRGHL